MDAAEYELMDSAEESMWWYRGVHSRIEEVLRRFLPQSARILDAGCGTGGLLARLKQGFPDFRLVGFDLDPDAARRAADKSGMPVATASVNALPFAGAAFDGVLSIDVLCSQGVDVAAALGDARACLKPGGFFVLNLPAFRWMMSDHDVRVHTARRYSRGEVLDLLSAHGFRPVSVFYWNSVLFPLMVLRRKVFRPKDAGSDVLEYPRLINSLFERALAVEQRLAGLGLKLPFGGSVMAVAVRADD